LTSASGTFDSGSRTADQAGLATMFVGAEVRAEVSAAVAAERLASLVSDRPLTEVSRQAWADGFAWVGPVPALSKLVRVQFSEPVRRGAVTVIALRWEATGATGRIFPVLDADITLAPDGEEATLLGLDGVYGPPGGAVGAGLDRVLLHRIATATIRSFLARIADAIASPPPTADRSDLAVSSQCGQGSPGI
jgi:hypothetical protein